MSPLPKETVPVENQLLAALPTKIYRRLLPHLEPVSLPVRKVLYQSGDTVRHVYFLNHAMVSLVCTAEDGAGVEVCLVGNEGMVGITAFMGAGTTPNLAIVQVAASGMRMKAGILREEFKRGGVLQDLLLHYTQVMLAQVSQVGLCNRFHKVEQRLCCWLLEAQDRIRTDQFSLTQEFISYMLGTRRTGVTEAAGHLKRAGLIRYSRGKLTILDRSGLEATACECYRVGRRNLDRLLAAYRVAKKRSPREQ